jgi:hypothetical protein
LLLDLIATQPAAAYGFRKLRRDYLGSCIRLRRSSDNAEQDIGFVGDALDTTAASAFIGGGSGFIRTLYEQGANANHLYQTDTAKQPLYSAGAMTLDGINDSLIMTTPISQTSGFTVFTNMTPNDTGGTKAILASDAVAGALYLRVSITEQFAIVRQSQAVLIASVATGLTAKAITEWKAGNTGGSIRRNGGVPIASYATDSLLTQPCSLVGATSSGGGDPFSGVMQEMIIYQANLSSADSNLIGADMAAFAGTSWTNI